MEHFDAESWVDFVRGVGDSTTSDQISAHLSTGCAVCQASLETWMQVRLVADREMGYAVSDDVVRAVKVEFAAQGRTEPQNCVTGRLVFDSLMQPMVAGIRAGALAARQTVYEVDGLTIDLRVDAQPHTRKISVIGQIFEKGAARARLNDASVVLWTEKGLPILVSKTTELGEFQLEFEAQDNLRLSIQIAGRRPIRIPLGNLA